MIYFDSWINKHRKINWWLQILELFQIQIQLISIKPNPDPNKMLVIGHYVHEILSYFKYPIKWTKTFWTWCSVLFILFVRHFIPISGLIFADFLLSNALQTITSSYCSFNRKENSRENICFSIWTCHFLYPFKKLA